MDSQDSRLRDELERVRELTGSDLAAFAALAEQGWRWIGVCGNMSERFLRLAVQPGRGIAGAVLRTGRAVALERHRNAADLRREDAALLLLERLTSIAAAPIQRDGATVGILLVGNRTDKDYDAEAMQLLVQALSLLATGATFI